MIKIHKITIESKMVQNQGNIVSDMDGEKVMLNIQNGKYYNLGESGGLIWELLEEPILIKQLIMELMKQYDIDLNGCENEVISFINSLYEEGLILKLE